MAPLPPDEQLLRLATEDLAFFVLEDLLETHGAVSEEVVRAMAQGAAKRTGARLAIAVSGVAGPGGGSESKPVGLVWFATYFDGEVHSAERRWPPVSRERIQVWATQKALCLALAAVLSPPQGTTAG